MPDVDSVLLLRPTAVATVFTQQLGRGLRRAEGQESPDGHRPDRSAAARVPLRAAAERDRRPPPRPAPAAKSRRLPVSAGRVPRRPRPPEPRDRARQPARCGAALAVEDAGRRPAWVAVADSRSVPREDRPRRSDVYRRQDQSWTRLQRDAGAASRRPASTAESAICCARCGGCSTSTTLNACGSIARSSLVRGRRKARLDERERRLLLMLHYDLWGTRRTFSHLDASFERFLVARVGSAELSRTARRLGRAKRAHSRGRPGSVRRFRCTFMRGTRGTRFLAPTARDRRRGRLHSAKGCGTSSPPRPTCCS